MKYLVCNAGSTSLKFKLYEMPGQQILSTGKVERVRSLDDAIFHYENCLSGYKVKLEGQCVPGYAEGIGKYLSELVSASVGVLKSLDEITCVCFKTVLSRGFYGVHELTDDVIAGMEEMLPVAPAHNIPYLPVVRLMKQLVPGARQIGCFEIGTPIKRLRPYIGKIVIQTDVFYRATVAECFCPDDSGIRNIYRFQNLTIFESCFSELSYLSH